MQAPKARPGASRGAGGAAPAWLTPNRLLLLVVLVGAIVAGVAIGVSVLGSGGTKSSGKVEGAAEVSRLFSGIPQHGLALGSSSAPVTLVEYADLQCPYCAQFAAGTLPALVERYVRPGSLRIEFRGIAFLGPESLAALRAVVAAGRQGRLWQMVDLLYRNQGDENSGWVTDDLLRAAGSRVRGLDVERMLGDRSLSSTMAAMNLAAQQASSLMGSRLRTPTFEIGRSGSALQRLDVPSLDPSAFAPAIDSLLGR